jgi:hypothetical protein
MDAAFAQTVGVWATVLGAAVFLARRAWRTYSRARHANKEASCGGVCGCADTSPEPPAHLPR